MASPLRDSFPFRNPLAESANDSKPQSRYKDVGKEDL